MDLPYLIAHPLEFFVFVFLPGLVFLFLMKLFFPELTRQAFKYCGLYIENRSGRDENTERFYFLGERTDRLIAISLVGGFLYALAVSITSAKLLYNGYPIGSVLITPQAVLYTWILAFVPFIIFLPQTLQSIISKGGILLSVIISIVLIFCFIFLVENIFVFTNASFYILPDFTKVDYYGRTFCNETHMMTDLTIFNRQSTPMIVYWIKKDSEFISLGTNATNITLPQLLDEKESLKFRVVMERQKEGSRIYIKTSDGIYPIIPKCDKIVTDTPIG